jgi:hypothetical protein
MARRDAAFFDTAHCATRGYCVIGAHQLAPVRPLTAGDGVGAARRLRLKAARILADAFDRRPSSGADPCGEGAARLWLPGDAVNCTTEFGIERSSPFEVTARPGAGVRWHRQPDVVAVNGDVLPPSCCQTLSNQRQASVQPSAGPQRDKKRGTNLPQVGVLNE